jgi:eukaryotic-like serine/threonine-protein kinase
MEASVTVLEIPTPDPRTLDDDARPFATAVASRYAIKRLIGRGGMGMVYLGRDRRLDRLVAIKTLPPHLAADESVRQRFFRETRMAGALSHPNIVPIFGADEVDGHAFFTMGFVDGDSLAAHVRGEGRLEPMQVASILRDVAAALEHAHERGIIHRDIKAENILLERGSRRALVTDFGIARLAEATPLTATGQILGTVYYTSPEQVTGEAVDGRSDLYSLGVVGFLALTGTFPFEAELASAVLVAHVNRPAPTVRSIAPLVPEPLAAIIDRCLAKDPANRYASAGELRLALEKAMRTTLAQSNGKPVLVSDAEAQEIWRRAAALQAATGVQKRPLPVRALRDSDEDKSVTTGLQVADIRHAGREAGIQTQFLDHALVEHGLMQGAGVAVEARRAWWAGVPLEIVREAELPREIDPKHFERLRRILQLATGAEGTTLAHKRELAWQTSSFGQSVSVSIVPEHGKTSVRVTQSARRMVVLTLLSAAAVGAAVVWPAITLNAFDLIRERPAWLRELGHLLNVTRSSANFLAALAGGIGALATVPVGYFVTRWLHRRMRERTDALLDVVVTNAGTSGD